MLTGEDEKRYQELRKTRFADFYIAGVEDISYNSTYQTITIRGNLIGNNLISTHTFGTTAKGLKSFLQAVNEYRGLQRKEDAQNLGRIISSMPDT